MSHIYKIPELGDVGITGAVASLSVNIGDTVCCGDTLLEVETDKVVLEVPAEVDGIVEQFLVDVGQLVQLGDEFIRIKRSLDEPVKDKPIKRVIEATPEPIPERVTVNVPTDAVSNTKVESQTPNSQKNISAGPASRRLARELGVDLRLVKGTGFRGRIDKIAVKAFARQQLSQKNTVINSVERAKLPDLSGYGSVKRQAMTGIQKVSGRNMSQSVERIPHAWLQRTVDITALEQSRQKYKEYWKAEGLGLSLTTLLCKVIAQAAVQHPEFNSCLDEQTEEIVFRQQINVGIAVDTPRGLLVPVIHNAESISVKEIARKLTELSAKARKGKLQPVDIKGGSITISNLGSLGVSGVLPLINWPEVAILGVGRAEWTATYRGGDITVPAEPRLMMPLNLAFDHRVINGADAARFLETINGLCEDPFLMMIS